MTATVNTQPGGLDDVAAKGLYFALVTCRKHHVDQAARRGFRLFFFRSSSHRRGRILDMKTERRHELATNALADWLGERIEALKPYSAAVSASAVAVLVLAFATVFWYQKREASAARAWEGYFTALDEQDPEKIRTRLVQVSEDYAQSSAGLWSRLSLADAQLERGIEALFQDRAGARKALEEAIDDYQAVLQASPNDSLLAERATFGLAQAYESKDELDSARQKYRELLDRWPEGAFSAMAKDRLADLDRKTTKEFYDWFAKQSPKVKVPLGPGIPGEKPPFDLDKLPDQIFDPGLNFDGKKAGTKLKPEAGDSSEDAKTTPEAPDKKPDETAGEKSGEEPAGGKSSDEKPSPKEP
jgi:predicted negative regulator of RcsB-dependent stress response